MHRSAAKKPTPNKSRHSKERAGIEATLYTDPLCCWTWALWPQWQKFCASCAVTPTLSLKMAGMLPSWDLYHDTLNSITRPIQMGPEWAHAKAVGHVPIDDRIWITDPPKSSYPACIAVKAAALQSGKAATDYFFLLQQAVMVQNLNISRSTVLLQLASELAANHPDFNSFLFREDLLGERGKSEFAKDLQQTKYLNITRLPTLVIRRPGASPFTISGYQTYDSLQAAFNKTPLLQ